MSTTILLTIIGLIVGAAYFGVGGFLMGGALGYLLGEVMRLSAVVKSHALDLNSLKKQLMQQKAVAEKSVVHDSQPASSPPTQPSSSPSPSQSTLSSPMEPTTTRIPLAERLKPLVIDESVEPIPDSTVMPSAASTEALAQISTPPLSAAESSSPHRPKNPPVQTRPAGPNGLDQLFNAIGQFFTQGNPIVRVGMVVMFFGLSFLVKYAAGQGLIPLELRLMAVAAVAMILMVIGWRTRAKPGGYGLVLQGGGVAALYLTIFAALKFYHLLPAGFALVLMLIMVMLATALAVAQNAQVLALMATAGGFMSPILTSDGSGNHVGLFTFYLLLNIGVLAIAWFKTWRMLNWTGFVFTFVITSAWGWFRYEPEFYAVTQPFLILYFALYLTVTVLFSLKQPPNLLGLVDGSLIFGLPIVGFGLQAMLLQHTETGLALSAVVLAAIYLLLARLLWQKYQHSQLLLIESFVALGVTFGTLAIPLAFDAEWTSATWALEAAGLIWIGLRQQQFLARFTGYALHAAAAISLCLDGRMNVGATPILTGDFIGITILSLSALCIGYLFHHFHTQVKPNEEFMGPLAVMIGWLWWLLAGATELNGHLPDRSRFGAMLIFFTLSCMAMVGLSRKWQWPQLNHLGFWLLPLASLWIIGQYTSFLLGNEALRPSLPFGLFALVVTLVTQYGFLWLQRAQDEQRLLSVYHTASAWLCFVLIHWELHWWQQHYSGRETLDILLGFIRFGLPLIVLMQCLGRDLWPFNQYQHEYKNAVPAPLMALMAFWFLAACGASGAVGFVYIPVVNPVDLAQLASIALLAYAINRNFLQLAFAPTLWRYGLLGMSIFIWLNVVVLRGVHHFGEVNYQAQALWSSPTAQMALSILWSFCALVVMNFSRREADRTLWIIGASILGLVVVKLFTQDLSGSGTLARIVSFLVVGGLMLLIGYVSPMPAKKSAEADIVDFDDETGGPA